MQGSELVTGKMPVPQVLLVKGQHYMEKKNSHSKNWLDLR